MAKGKKPTAAAAEKKPESEVQNLYIWKEGMKNNYWIMEASSRERAIQIAELQGRLLKGPKDVWRIVQEWEDKAHASFEISEKGELTIL